MCWSKAQFFHGRKGATASMPGTLAIPMKSAKRAPATSSRKNTIKLLPVLPLLILYFSTSEKGKPARCRAMACAAGSEFWISVVRIGRLWQAARASGNGGRFSIVLDTAPS